MKHCDFRGPLGVLVLGGMLVASAVGADIPPPENGFVVIPSPTNAVQLRLYTDASPQAAHLFNTFDVEGYGERLLPSPARARWQQESGGSATIVLPHNILVKGSGPDLAATNSMRVIEEVSGPEWRYLALDVSPAYRGRLERFRRAVLHVQPDLFVLYDCLVAKEPVNFQMMLYPPSATRLDTHWGELHLDLPKASMIVHSPGRKRDPRPWQKLELPTAVLPDTVAMRLGPTNQVAQLHVLTVFAVPRAGQKKDYRFTLLESSSAIGVQIQRAGLPTLVAFKTDPTTNSASLVGFPFRGPAGVYVFKPKAK